MNSGSSSSSQPLHPKKSQATSCAECRRLKLKCDRVWPCAQCIRRGCGNLCPEGTLQKGKRGFLKRLEQALPQNTDAGGESSGKGSTEVAVFVSRDAAMAKRIQELEAALIDAGVDVPGLPRTAKHKKAKSNNKKRARSASPDSSKHAEANANESSGDSDPELTAGFGTLTIDPKNSARYIGLSSGSAYLDSHLWGSGKEGVGVTSLDDDYFKKDIEAQIFAALRTFPPYEESIRLANLYYQHLSFMYEIVPKEKFYSTHLPSIYNHSSTLASPVHHHTVALVGIVLALGQYFDLEQPRELVRPRAMELFRLAAFALNSHSTMDGGLKVHTIQGVQTLHIMALFNLSTNNQGSGVENAWQLLGLAARSMQAQGLHMDGSRWNLTDLEERRRVFWEVYVYDRLQSFTVGRPYALSDAHFDCKMPTSGDTPLPSDSDPSNSTYSYSKWHIFKFRWGTLLGRIMDDVFSIKRPTYSTIMQYDREINDFYFSAPQWLHFPHVAQPVDASLWRELYPEGTRYNPYEEGGFKGLGKPECEQRDSQRCAFSILIFTAKLHMHRGPFCRAMLMDRKGMIKTESIERVVASSKALVDIARGMFVLHPNLTSRIWYCVFHAFTAAVCQAVFVIVAPFHPLATLAFRSLKDAVELLAQVDGPGASTALARLSQLVDKADRSMKLFKDSASSRKRASAEGSNAETNVPSRSEDGSGSGSIARYPESNVRNAADFLGASTKLVREETLHPSSEDMHQQDLASTGAPPQQQQLPMDFTRTMELYNTSKSTLDVDQSMFQQPYMSHSSSQATTELLPKLRSWMAGPATPLPKENYNDNIAGIPNESLPNFDIPELDWIAAEYMALNPSAMDESTFQHGFHDLGVGVNQSQASDAIAGYMPHFNEVHGFDLSSFIQDGAKAWAYEPLTTSQ